MSCGEQPAARKAFGLAGLVIAGSQLKQMMEKIWQSAVFESVEGQTTRAKCVQNATKCLNFFHLKKLEQAQTSKPSADCMTSCVPCPLPLLKVKAIAIISASTPIRRPLLFSHNGRVDEHTERSAARRTPCSVTYVLSVRVSLSCDGSAGSQSSSHVTHDFRGAISVVTIFDHTALLPRGKISAVSKIAMSHTTAFSCHHHIPNTISTDNKSPPAKQSLLRRPNDHCVCACTCELPLRHSIYWTGAHQSQLPIHFVRER